MTKRLLLSLLCLTALWTGHASNRLTHRRQITMDDGLPSNTVRNVVQDHWGYIWMGTDNGLCRYDGTRVQLFPIATDDHPPTLPANNQYVSALLPAPDGLYVGTEQGIFFFHIAQHTFTRLPLDISRAVNGMALDHDGTLWASTLGQGIWHYSPTSGKSHHYEMTAWNGAVGQVFIDRDNHVWAVTNWGMPPVMRLNKVRDDFEPANLNYTDDCHALSMLQTADGTLWIGTWEEGLLRIGDDGTLTPVLSPRLDGVGHHIHTLCELSAESIAIGCDDGVVSFNPQTRQWAMLPGERFAYTIVRDTEGGLWTGTFYGGVGYLSSVSNRFEAFTADGSEGSLTGNVISRFCEDGQQRVWIASDDGGLICFDPQTNGFAGYPHQTELSRINAHALCMDENDLWIGTYTDGVYVMNTVTGQLRHYGPADLHGLSDPSSYAIMRDRSGTMWVATMNGINRYDRTTDTFVSVKQLNTMIIDIDEDRDGHLWLSTEGNGLWQYTPATGGWQQFSHHEGDDSTLPNDQVNAAMVDGDGHLWVATLGGLCRYDEQQQAFRRIRLDLPTQNIMGIVEDQDALWLATEKGVVKYVAQDGTQRFTRQDGLVSEQAQPNACLKTSDGRIYVGTTSGFNTFYPFQIKANSTMAPVYITEVSGLLPQASRLLPSEKLSLDYDDARMLTIAFAALSYCSPEKNEYAYRLDGFDEDWHYVGNQTKATYTNIPPGSYTFRVRATNNDGIWSDHIAQLHIVVHPPFWWSWPAKLFYLLLIVAAIWWLIHEKLKQAEQRHQREMQQLKEQQEHEVHEARLQFFTTIAHEIRTPVSLIIGPLEKMKKDVQNTAPLLHSSLTTIDRNAHRLLELVNQLLDFRKVEQQSMVMHFEPYDVRALLQGVAERFAPTFEQNGKHFTADMPEDGFTAVVDREGLIKVVSNLLSNANKYTKDQVELRCRVTPDGDRFTITVSDNGAGISPSDRQLIFEPFFQAHDNKPGTGIGLSIVKNIVEQHHGTVSVESRTDEGTAFTVELPMRQPQAPPTVTARPDETVVAPPPTDRCTLLIVDDNEEMTDFLATNFSDRYQVLTAHDGLEALDLLRRSDVSIVVSDWMMPHMDGAQLCRHIRADQSISHVGFIMLTAKTDTESKVEGMDVGADAYIEKPFSVEFLEGCIRNMLDMRRRLRERFATMPLEPITGMAANATDNDFLQRMNKLIEDNFANPNLNVNFLAEQLCISRSGLFAKIKTLADLTPNEMIQMVRLKRAAQLLREGGHQVSEVCYMVGFSNPSYFSKCFYRQFGVKPGSLLP